MKRRNHSLEAGTAVAVHPLPLNSALSTPWDFLRPTKELRTTIVDAAKTFLDPLAASVSNSQSTRNRNSRKRRKTGDDQDATSVLRLKQLYVDGFTPDQIWEQAVRIFDSANQEVERDYSRWSENVGLPLEKEETAILDLTTQNGGDLEEGSFQSSLSDSTGFSGSDGEQTEMEDELGTGEASDNESAFVEGEDYSSDESSSSKQSNIDGDKVSTYIEDRFGLNDGFFSIEDFNKETELFERKDSKGGFDDDDDSDDEGIDWHTNPLNAGESQGASKKVLSSADHGSTSDSDDEGPTFDNMGSMDGSESENGDGEAHDLEGANWMNTSDIMYADFFAPPPRKASTKKSRPLPKTQPQEAISQNEINRAMADTRRDLFEDEASLEGSENEADDSHGPQSQRSSHEKQRARIADEIRRLEAANIAKKEWMVSGEARAVERPVNSLIEEDLDFERIGKPVPVVTTELSESIEELVKRRIVAKEFDEVVRRRPGLSDRRSTEKARIELDDSKPQQSLAELYEADHLQKTDSNYVDPQNQKLLKEHADITSLWRDISSQLDTLSNWHYKPRAPQASINVVTDVATITMEDAQPITSSAVRQSATLAPQEIYAPGDEARAPGELVMRNGVTLTKEEMTREDKSKLRRRQKKQNKLGTDNPGPRKGTGSEKQQIVSDLKKAGVKLIGKEGKVTDMHGNKISGSDNRNGAHGIKL